MSASTYLIIFGIVVILSLIISVYAINKVIKVELNKKIKIDITAEEMLDREKRVSDFLKTNNINPGESIQKIADALRIKDGGVSENVNGRAILSEPDSYGNMTVVYSINVPTRERLFDLAHECGHLINGDPTPANRPSGYNKPKMDQLADYTAAALLMPKEELIAYLDDINYESISKGKRLSFVKKLSKKYKVDEIVVIRRINEVRILEDRIS